MEKFNKKKKVKVGNIILTVSILVSYVLGYKAYDMNDKMNKLNKQLNNTQENYDKLKNNFNKLNENYISIKKDYDNIENKNKKLLNENEELKKEISQLRQRKITNNQKKESSKILSNSNGDYKSWKKIRMEATGYTANCSEGCTGITATGIDLNKNPNQKVIAVDPRIIQLGSQVYVEGYGYAIAGDTGGAIKGYIIDVYFKSHNTAVNWGRRMVDVYVKM